MKNIVIAAGGTGGHLYPAQVLAEELEQKGYNICFMGAGLEGARWFEKQRWEVHEISSASFKRKGLFGKFTAGLRLLKGTFQSLFKIRKKKPDLVVGFGSHHSFPVMLAARLLKLPLVLHEANGVPGEVTRFFSSYAKVTALHFPEAAKKLKGPTVVSGMPLRSGCFSSSFSKEEARRFFGLDPELFTFLVFGGSQGAERINRLFSEALCEYLALRTKQYQVIHLTGSPTVALRLEVLYRDHGIKAYVREFEKNMDKAWAAADLVVSRAGAMTLAEQLQMEVPSILIPYPFSADGHQDVNANHMVGRVKGSIKFYEAELSSERLALAVNDLIGDDRKKLREMQKNMRQYKVDNHQNDLCSIVCGMMHH